MSFRARLTLFFLLIVVLPMVAVALLVTRVVSDSAGGKADARLAAGIDAALATYRDDSRHAAHAIRRLVRGPTLGVALSSGDRGRIQAGATEAARAQGVRALAIRDRQGHELARVGAEEIVAAATLALRGPSGAVGELVGSTTTPRAYLAAVRHLTGRDAVLSGPRGTISTTTQLGGASLPASGHSGDVEVAGASQRAATTSLPGPRALRLTLLGPPASSGFLSSSPAVAGVLAAFFGVALLFVVMLLRVLGGQVGTMLEAARRIGAGNFSRTVPVVGRDEMAGLASEFNKMSDRLAEQMEELRRQQVEIDRSVRRIGEAFASGLDREALLEVVVETALAACRAAYGTIALTGRTDRQGGEAEAGDASADLRDVAAAAEGAAMRSGEPVARDEGDLQALASPLRRLGEQSVALGAVTVARRGVPFTASERDVFLYLVGQVSASIENIALHELVSEQAVTDELTGLSNPRRFRDLIRREADRAERFGHPLSLIMLDIDDFKRVNDTHGHLQGDEVLRQVGRVLDAESRGVDEPARYGGEEFTVALPETGLQGALEVAERIRSRLETEPVPRTDGAGSLRVTASLGVATMPSEVARTASELFAAADAALYQAKRSGKNLVATASATGSVAAR